MLFCHVVVCMTCIDSGQASSIITDEISTENAEPMDHFNLMLRGIDQQVKEAVIAECDDAGQMTLGPFITALEVLEQSKQIAFDFCGLAPTRFSSYRGYYDHLQLEFAEDGNTTVGEALAKARAAMGNAFAGYKGGDYTMHAGTPLWAGVYGRSSGSRIVGIKARECDVLILTQPSD